MMIGAIYTLFSVWINTKVSGIHEYTAATPSNYQKRAVPLYKDDDGALN